MPLRPGQRRPLLLCPRGASPDVNGCCDSFLAGVVSGMFGVFAQCFTMYFLYWIFCVVFIGFVAIVPCLLAAWLLRVFDIK
jgi:hypothetical protein